MKVQIVTQCTGDKAVWVPEQLTAADFEAGPEAIALKHAQLSAFLRPAEVMYTGRQQLLLREGRAAARAFAAAHHLSWELPLWIVSAGYGLIPGEQLIAPYDCTFKGLGAKQVAQWATKRGIPAKVRAVLREPFDLGLILLGKAYLQTCALDDHVVLAGPTLLFAGQHAQTLVPDLPNLRVVTIRPADTTRFSAGHVALKGELGARVLRYLIHHPDGVSVLMRPGTDVLDALARAQERAGPGHCS